MDWANERYVRVYVRDTADLLAIGWQGRHVLYEMMRKCDRAGVLDGDVETLPDMLRIPRDVIEPGIAALIRRNVVVAAEENGSPAYLIKNFMPAQEAKQSDAQRQRESRARRRDAMRRGVTKRDSGSDEPPLSLAETAQDELSEDGLSTPAVTFRDDHGEQSVTKRDRNVTGCHTESQPVTPSLAVPKDQDPSDPCQPALLPDELLAGQDFVRGVWDYFCKKRLEAFPDSKGLKFTTTRRGHIRARLKERSRGTPEKGRARELCEAIKKFFDPRYFWALHGHNKPELVFRSAEQLEKVRDAKPYGQHGQNVTPIQPPSKPKASEDCDALYEAQLAAERHGVRKVGPTLKDMEGFDPVAARAKIEAELAAKEAAKKAAS